MKENWWQKIKHSTRLKNNVKSVYWNKIPLIQITVRNTVKKLVYSLKNNKLHNK